LDEHDVFGDGDGSSLDEGYATDFAEGLWVEGRGRDGVEGVV
jgi:hypothetical protein